MGNLSTCFFLIHQPSKEIKSSVYTESSYLGYSYKEGANNNESIYDDKNTKKKFSESFSFNHRLPDSKPKEVGSSFKFPSSLCEFCGNKGCAKCSNKDSFK